MVRGNGLGRWFRRKALLARFGLIVPFGIALTHLGLLWAAQTSASGVWYVKPAGSDANDCATPQTACATINGAMSKNLFVEGDTIKIAAGTFTGTGSEVLLLRKDVVLSGGWKPTFDKQKGMTVIDGQGARRGIWIRDALVSIDHFTIQNGFAKQEGAGGLRNDGGNVTLDFVVISSNLSYGYGGGGVNNGTMFINHARIISNKAENASALYNRGSLKIENSTINGNSPRKPDLGLTIYNEASLEMLNSTITNNADPFATIFQHSGTSSLENVTVSDNLGIGLRRFQGNVGIRNSIFANNLGGDCKREGTSANAITSEGYSLVKTNVNCVLAGTDLVGIDPMLQPLKNNGGFTLTKALSPGSAAINLVPVANCQLTQDQRGVSRPVGVSCDAGAYEATGAEPTPTPTSTPKPPSAAIKMMQEDFESTFPRGAWQVLDGWGKTNCQKVSGNYSAYASLQDVGTTCKPKYLNNSFNWMIYGPFSLKDAKSAALKYNLMLNAELQKDFLFVGASTNGQDFYGTAYTGSSGRVADKNVALRVGEKANSAEMQFMVPSAAQSPEAVQSSWVRMKFNLKKVPTLGNLAGKDSVYIGFLFGSDSSTVWEGGAYVDDVLLTKVKK